MPGPLSTPKHWGKEKRNKTGEHGYRADGTRASGKSQYDRESGKWQQHYANKAVNRQAGFCYPASSFRA